MGTLAVIVTCGVLVWVNLTRSAAPQGPAAPAVRARPPAPVPTAPVSIEGAAVKGDSSAPVAVIEYSDFECPFCSTFARNTLPQFEREYIAQGKVLFAFRHAPIESIHPRAVAASASAECARQQGRFWDMHDKLFANPRQLDDATLITHASNLSLDMPQFRNCLASGPAAIKKESTAAAELSVFGTPTFFVGRMQGGSEVIVAKRLAGASFSALKSAVDEVIAQLK